MYHSCCSLFPFCRPWAQPTRQQPGTLRARVISQASRILDVLDVALSHPDVQTFLVIGAVWHPACVGEGRLLHGIIKAESRLMAASSMCRALNGPADRA
jgi:hypothetical protein